MNRRGRANPAPGEPLRRFNVLRARDPDEMQERLGPLYAITKLDVPRSKARFDAILNHHQLQIVGLSYARYGAPVQMTMSNTDFYTQGFGVRGYGEATTDGVFYKIMSGQGGAAGPGAAAYLDYQAGLEHVFLKIPPEALHRKLAALLGNPVSRPLQLRGEYDMAALAAQYRFFRFLISELDRAPDSVPPLLLAEFEQALMTAYLYANLNNYSDRLTAKHPGVAPWQVRRAMEYIDANWDRPLTIESLASATESSARSLFAAFHKSRGCSPMAYVRHVRLLRAHDALTSPNPDTSVASVATSCGFVSPSHFAKKYLRHFGERPSETLKRGKWEATARRK